MTVPRSAWKKTNFCITTAHALTPNPLGLGTEALQVGPWPANAVAMPRTTSNRRSVGSLSLLRLGSSAPALGSAAAARSSARAHAQVVNKGRSMLRPSGFGQPLFQLMTGVQPIGPSGSDMTPITGVHAATRDSGARTFMTAPLSVWKRTGSCLTPAHALTPDPLGRATEALRTEWPPAWTIPYQSGRRGSALWVRRLPP